MHSLDTVLDTEGQFHRCLFNHDSQKSLASDMAEVPVGPRCPLGPCLMAQRRIVLGPTGALPEAVSLASVHT